MIFVDRRVGSCELAPLLKTKAIVTELEFGDVSFAGSNNETSLSIGIERKRIRDLINSIGSGRLSAHQLPGMLANYDRSYVIVEGVWRGDRQTGELLISSDGGRTFRSLYKGNKRWSVAGVYSYLTTIETYLGVPFRMTRDARDTARTIDMLYGWWQRIERHKSHMAIHTKQFRDTVDGPCVLAPNVMRSATNLDGVSSIVRYVSAQLPHVDSKRSIDVAKRFTCLRELFEATEKDWLSIPGIGKQTARDVMKILHNNEEK
jgi:ERCC4-type nuclease